MGERAELRRLAEDAIAGDPMDEIVGWACGRWEPWFNFHGDPYVVEAGRGQWAVVATVSTAPEDYGKARAEFIGAADPATVLALLDIADAAAEILRPARGDAPWLHTAEFDKLRAALLRDDVSGATRTPESDQVGPESNGRTNP